MTEHDPTPRKRVPPELAEPILRGAINTAQAIACMHARDLDGFKRHIEAAAEATAEAAAVSERLAIEADTVVAAVELAIEWDESTLRSRAEAEARAEELRSQPTAPAGIGPDLSRRATMSPPPCTRSTR